MPARPGAMLQGAVRRLSGRHDDLPPRLRDEVEVEKLLQLNRNQLVAAAIGIINPLLLTSALWSYETGPFLAFWLAVGLALGGLQLRAWYRNRHRPRPSRAPRDLDARVCLAACVGSLYWAILSVIVLPQASEAGVLAIAIVVSGTGVGGAVLLALVPAAAAIYFGIAVVPTVAMLFTRLPETPWLLPLLMVNLFLFMVYTVNRIHRVFFENWANSIETGRLAKEARAAARTKAEFIANMSHELRTPLNAINGFSEAMAEELFGDLGSDRYRGYARHIRGSGNHLLVMINDMIDISRIEAGRYDLEIAEVALADVLERAQALAAHRAMSSDVELRLRLPGDRAPVNLDCTAIAQVLLNVLSIVIGSCRRGDTVELIPHPGADGSLVLAVRPSGAVPKAGRGAATATGPVPAATRGDDDDRETVAAAGGGFPGHVVGSSGDPPLLGLQLAQALMALHGGEIAIRRATAAGNAVELRFPPGTVVEPLAVAGDATCAS